MDEHTPLQLDRRIRDRAARCEQCPPDRVCAWCCEQGAGVEDILIGAVLARSSGWALKPECASATGAVSRALWETYNG